MRAVEEGRSRLEGPFSQLMERLSRRSGAEVREAARLVSRALSQGHVCADLRQASESGTVPWGMAEWRVALLMSGVVGVPNEEMPLVLDGANRLFLHRFWEYQERLAAGLVARAGALTGANEERIEAALGGVTSEGLDVDWQKVAVLVGATRGLCLISGGPGTGKTRTIGTLLDVLDQTAEEPLRVVIAAPTGKAAARVEEAIRSGRGAEPWKSLRLDVGTLHRVLGARRGAAGVGYDRDNPLPADMLIVDETSMADLALLAKAVEALKPRARLVLAGDADQLAPVEAGSAFAEICQAGARSGFSQEFLTRFGLASVGIGGGGPMSDCFVGLRRNYRFETAPGLATLARAVRSGDGLAAVRQLVEQPGAGVLWRELPRPGTLKAALRTWLVPWMRHVLGAGSVQESLERLQRRRMFAAVRRGPYGVESLNALAEEVLAEAGLIVPETRQYHGRPVMIARNDYGLQLFNGESGWIVQESQSGADACFLDGSGAVRRVPAGRLPLHETAYAWTVHKSQGSEVDEALFIMPQVDGPLMTREMIYTALTRARNKVEVWCTPELFALASGRSTERASGLVERLLSRQGVPGAC